MSNDRVSEVSMHHALLRMAEVLRGMTGDMTSVTHLVSDLSMDRSVDLSPAQISQLQSLDRLVQSLRDLTIISSGLADGTLCSAGKMSQLQLAETRAILDPMDAHTPLRAPGTVDLF